MRPDKKMTHRLDRLQDHLRRENPVLVSVVDRYRNLDKIAQKIGLLKESESYATQISWWPLVSVLGTFSAGKSSFINTYLGLDLQETGNQAVDDRFTVVSYSADKNVRTLPGLALDGDPRFPFYKISSEIEEVSEGEGAKIDNYLQMKATPSEKVRGKIIIDSPGFDADEQRKSILKITDHIIDLSDLVLVLFDARHPEPGAMQDTLEHLVRGAQRRNDSGKFLFILNQIDTSARDDNLEQIVSAWQKSLIQTGLVSGRFYVMYNEELAVPVDDKNVWDRYVSKRASDYEKIMKRMEAVETDRVYRITGALESLVNQLEQQAIPQITQAKQSWRKRVLWIDAVVATLVLGATSIGSHELDLWNFSAIPSPNSLLITAIVLAVVLVGLHFFIRAKVANSIAKSLDKESPAGNIQQAFLKSTKIYRSIFFDKPAGWGRGTMNKLNAVRHDIEVFVQDLNDKFTSPAGEEDDQEKSTEKNGEQDKGEAQTKKQYKPKGQSKYKPKAQDKSTKHTKETIETKDVKL
ncbi:MAG: dynamin family protein [Cocleimonas sp.]|nr:dynamin family protein [Cocleimonas sp.]